MNKAFEDVIAEARYRAGESSRRGVRETFEWERVRDLPSRDWEDEDIVGITALLEKTYGREGRTMHLRGPQAAALAEFSVYRFAFVPLAVGGGKTVISILAGAVVNARRPMLFVPPDLRQQTLRTALPELRRQFVFPEPMVVGANELGLLKNADMLEREQPDCIIIDEADQWRNVRAGRVRRMDRYLRAHPEVPVMALSGTVTKQSVMDYWHILRWTHGERWMPLPSRWVEAKDWAAALDAHVPEQDKLAPGALARLVPGVTSARLAYQERLLSTPGVVATRSRTLGVALTIRRRPVEVPEAVTSALSDLEDRWVTPAGIDVEDAKDLGRARRQIACGFYYYWDPAPPKEWVEARAAWAQLCNNFLRNNRQGLDTELQARSRLKGNSIRERWVALKPTFEPHVRAKWISDFMLRDAERWAREVGGIVWTEHQAFGAAIGLDYYGEGTELMGVRGPVCASIRVHGIGKNLQEQWSRNLVCYWPGSGRTVEQLMGRTHRDGQLAKEVVIETYMFTGGHRRAWQSSLRDAAYLEETTGNAQRILYANKEIEDGSRAV